MFAHCFHVRSATPSTLYEDFICCVMVRSPNAREGSAGASAVAGTHAHPSLSHIENANGQDMPSEE